MILTVNQYILSIIAGVLMGFGIGIYFTLKFRNKGGKKK